MGRNNPKYYRDLWEQAYMKLTSMQAFGESKKAAIAEGTAKGNDMYRMARQSETIAMMCEGKVIFHEQEKPDPKNALLNDKRDVVYFYESREIKPLYYLMSDTDDKKEQDNASIGRAKCYGTVYSKDDIYTVYHMRKEATQRYIISQEKEYMQLSKFLRKEFTQHSVKEPAKRIIFVNDYERLSEIIFQGNAGGSKSKGTYQETEGRERKSNKTLFDKKFGFNATYLFPLDEIGQKQLRLLLHYEDTRSRINEIIGLKGTENATEEMDDATVIINGVTHTHICFILPDVQMLRKLLLFAQLWDRDDRCYHIHCLDVHERYIREAVEETELENSTVDIVTYKIGDIEKHFSETESMKQYDSHFPAPIWESRRRYFERQEEKRNGG